MLKECISESEALCIISTLIFYRFNLSDKIYINVIIIFKTLNIMLNF